jgi:hypothetical protein
VVAAEAFLRLRLPHRSPGSAHSTQYNKDSLLILTQIKRSLVDELAAQKISIFCPDLNCSRSCYSDSGMPSETTPDEFDFILRHSNNPPMARPDGVRRVKSYSAANGYVYQYCFYEGNRTTYEGTPAGEFTYAVSADRQTTFPLRIIVRQSALIAWAKANGRPLTSSEEYAVAKMRLLQGFDEGSVPLTAAAAQQIHLLVDESNLDTLLEQLNI